MFRKGDDGMKVLIWIVAIIAGFVGPGMFGLDTSSVLATGLWAAVFGGGTCFVLYVAVIGLQKLKGGK